MIVNRLKHQRELVNNKKITNLWLVFLYVAVCSLLIFSFYKNIKLLISSRNELEKAQELLKKENLTLEENKTKLNEIGNSMHVEKIARDILGLGKKDEIVLVFPDNIDIRHLSPRFFSRENNLKAKPMPVWKEWLRLFF